jgi:hypothetical protein
MALFGMSFIFAAVCFISIGEGLGEVKSANDISFFHRAIASSLTTGFLFSCNMLIKQLSFLSGYALPPIQINFDVCLAQGLILLPFYVYWDTNNYTANDLWLTSLGYFLANTGSIFQTYALKYGQGAITQSFINLNAVW